MQVHQQQYVRCSPAPEPSASHRNSAWIGLTHPYVDLAALAVILSCCSQFSGCAVVAGLAADGVYAAAFRTTIVDLSKLSPQDQDKVNSVKILAAADAPPHSAKGSVKGFACKLLGASGWQWRPAPSEINGSTPEQAALSQLKIKSVQLGGNAVLLESCIHGDAWDWGNNCFDTWTCIGQSIRIP